MGASRKSPPAVSKRLVAPGDALYTPAWVGILLLIALLVLGSRLAPRPSDELGRDALRVRPPVTRLVPRQPGAYQESLAGRRILIDPGHGGADPGAIGLSTLPEKTIALDTALRLAALLERTQSRGLLTRRDDRAPGGTGQDGLRERVERARRSGAEVMVSLHADASYDSAVRGVTTYYYHPGDVALALAIHEELVARLGVPDRGVRRADFYVLRASPVPAVLVELGFLTNPVEAALLSSGSYRQRAAEAIADGLARYFASLGSR